MTLQEILVRANSSNAHKAKENLDVQQAKTAQLLKQNKAAANKILMGALAQLESSSPTASERKERIWI